jgi:hypothetical protein
MNRIQNINPESPIHPVKTEAQLEQARQAQRRWCRRHRGRAREVQARWQARHPGRRQEIKRAFYQRHRPRILQERRQYTRQNSATLRYYASRYIASLADGYVRSLLRRLGVEQPTAEQVVAHRRYVRMWRARRTLRHLSYGAGIDH